MSLKRIDFLMITDPWDTLDHANDTTLRLAQAALDLGYRCSWSDVHSLALIDGKRTLEAQPFQSISASRTRTGYRMGPVERYSIDAFKQIHYRVDPPVHLAYLHPLQMLSHAPGEKRMPEIVNSALALLCSNEKLEGILAGLPSPSTCVSSRWEELRDFGRGERVAVAKPLHEAQSKGVAKLRFDSRAEVEKSKKIISELSAGFSQPILLQQYLPGILNGEQRLWFVNGHLLACVRKNPKPGQFKIDMDRGGTLKETTLSTREARTARLVGKRLRTMKIRLAAVDLIDGLVTDFNITSPGLIVGMEQLLRVDLASQIIKSLAKPWI